MHDCSGCVKWEDSARRSLRDKCKSRDVICLCVWENKSIDKVPPRFQKHYDAVKLALEKQQEMTIEAWQQQTLATPTADGSTPVVHREDTDTPEAVSTETIPRKLNYKVHHVKSQKHSVQVGVPNTHTLIHKTELTKLKDIELKYKKLKNQVDRLRSPASLSPTARTIYSTAIATAPAIALSTMEHVIPLIAYASLLDSGLLDDVEVGVFS